MRRKIVIAARPSSGQQVHTSHPTTTFLFDRHNAEAFNYDPKVSALSPNQTKTKKNALIIYPSEFVFHDVL